MKRVLVLRHGIVINRYFMVPMERYFRRLGYDVHNRGYPTTKKAVREHARDLVDEIRAIDIDLSARGEEYELYCITHSLGGLVLRYALTHFDLPRVRRAVLLVPPNQGAVTARHFKNFPPYRWLFGGKAGRELTQDPPGIFGECGVPDNCEIGIIAGDVRYRMWGAPVERPHDGVVEVREAELPPYPLRVLPYGHTPILFVRYAWEETEHFLRHGRFRAAEAAGRSTESSARSGPSR